jgi:hypothetical protein
MRNFIHTTGTTELTVVDVEPETTAADIAAAHGAADSLLFVDDNEEPLTPTTVLSAAGVGDDSHLHVARCKRVTATVNFKEDQKSHDFPPNVAMKAVFEWATGPKGFALSAADKAEHMLVIADTETQVDEDAHLEAYVVGDACAAEFDLVPKHRFEG